MSTQPTPRQRLQARAARQLGHFSADDAEACGVTKSAVHRMLAARMVERVAPARVPLLGRA